MGIFSKSKSKTIVLDQSAIETIQKIAKELDGMEEIEVIRNGLRLISLYADLHKKGGKMLIQQGENEPSQELKVP